MPFKKGNDMELYFFSLGMKLPFISEIMLSCKLVGDLHTAHGVFCLDMSCYLGKCLLAPRLLTQVQTSDKVLLPPEWVS